MNDRDCPEKLEPMEPHVATEYWKSKYDELSSKYDDLLIKVDDDYDAVTNGVISFINLLRR